jgi:hypothetical protein
MMKPEDFLRLLIPQGGPAASLVRLGKIPPGYAGGAPTVIFDGETAPSVRTYPVADHVTTLAAGKSVAVLMTGESSGLIIAAWTRP